jgi:hypothetical protein
MNALIIEATKGTPRIRLYPNGEMYIEGRSLPENPVEFYFPVLAWVKNCTAVDVSINIRIEYMNTSSSKELYTFFKYIKNNQNIKKACINWFYEEGDDDIYDIGREFENVVQLPFYYHEYAEAVD